MKKILVTGSRTWTDTNTICVALAEEFSDDLAVLIHGDCPRGADSIAKLYALMKEHLVKSCPADWERYGNKAGPIRNAEMIALQPDVCLVFAMPCVKKGCMRLPAIHVSHGTYDCMRQAQKARIPVRFFPGIEGLEM